MKNYLIENIEEIEYLQKCIIKLNLKPEAILKETNFLQVRIPICKDYDPRIDYGFENVVGQVDQLETDKFYWAVYKYDASSFYYEEEVVLTECRKGNCYNKGRRFEDCMAKFCEKCFGKYTMETCLIRRNPLIECTFSGKPFSLSFQEASRKDIIEKFINNRRNFDY